MYKNRLDISREIETLDPVTDHQRIVYLVGSYEYPWLIRKSLEFALFRTYAVPHTSRILAATGQFERHGQKRYDDTTLMLAGMAEHGYDSEYGQIAIKAMNRLHGRYKISNRDFLYVLSTFMLEPTRWHEKYGWRKPTQTERLANFYFWREVGIRMGIENIPETVEEIEAFNIAHEREYFRYDEANRVIGEATINVFLSWYPRFLRPLVREGLYAMMEDELLQAFGFTKPHAIFRWSMHYGLKALAFVLRHSAPRKEPFSFISLPTRTYGDSFDIGTIGAP